MKGPLPPITKWSGWSVTLIKASFFTISKQDLGRILAMNIWICDEAKYACRNKFSQAFTSLIAALRYDITIIVLYIVISFATRIGVTIAIRWVKDSS